MQPEINQYNGNFALGGKLQLEKIIVHGAGRTSALWERGLCHNTEDGWSQHPVYTLEIPSCLLLAA